MGRIHARREFLKKSSAALAGISILPRSVLGGPGKISEQSTEAEVFTRWDTPEQVQSYLPEDVTFEGWRGVRVFTPAAVAFKVPLAEKILPALEERVLNSPLARFGGFLIAVCRKN